MDLLKTDKLTKNQKNCVLLRLGEKEVAIMISIVYACLDPSLFDQICGRLCTIVGSKLEGRVVLHPHPFSITNILLGNS